MDRPSFNQIALAHTPGKKQRKKCAIVAYPSVGALQTTIPKESSQVQPKRVQWFDFHSCRMDIRVPLLFSLARVATRLQECFYYESVNAKWRPCRLTEIMGQSSENTRRANLVLP